MATLEALASEIRRSNGSPDRAWYAILRTTTLIYLENVGSQFLSLRQIYARARSAIRQLRATNPVQGRYLEFRIWMKSSFEKWTAKPGRIL
jgi:hypothetical protein